VITIGIGFLLIMTVIIIQRNRTSF
jgi:hypothetical protein